MDEDKRDRGIAANKTFKTNYVRQGETEALHVFNEEIRAKKFKKIFFYKHEYSFFLDLNTENIVYHHNAQHIVAPFIIKSIVYHC
jgi:hypothetical protein